MIDLLLYVSTNLQENFRDFPEISGTEYFFGNAYAFKPSRDALEIFRTAI